MEAVKRPSYAPTSVSESISHHWQKIFPLYYNFRFFKHRNTFSFFRLVLIRPCVKPKQLQYNPLLFIDNVIIHELWHCKLVIMQLKREMHFQNIRRNTVSLSNCSNPNTYFQNKVLYHEGKSECTFISFYVIYNIFCKSFIKNKKINDFQI